MISSTDRTKKPFHFKCKLYLGDGAESTLDLSTDGYSEVCWNLAKEVAEYIHSQGLRSDWPVQFQLLSEDEKRFFGTYLAGLEMVPRFNVECVVAPYQAAKEE